MSDSDDMVSGGSYTMCSIRGNALSNARNLLSGQDHILSACCYYCYDMSGGLYSVFDPEHVLSDFCD
jgi:hypothetical protein